MIVGVAHLTNQGEVRGRHGGGIVGHAGRGKRVGGRWKSRQKKGRGIPTFPPPRRRRLRNCFLIPQATLQFPPPFLSHTLQPRQGDTMWVGSTNRRFALTGQPGNGYARCPSPGVSPCSTSLLARSLSYYRGGGMATKKHSR